MMRIAIVCLTSALLALPACHQQQAPQDQNISIDDPTLNGVPANADVEALPPDESSETPSDELSNGDDNPDVGDLNSDANAN